MLRFYILVFNCLLCWSAAHAQSGPAVVLADTSLQPEPTAAAAAAPAPVQVYFTADVMPSFPGGEAGFQKFLRSSTKYPEEALQQGISGKVHVRFVVDEKGRIRDAEVIKGVGYGLDEEALRLVRIMPWWTPGTIQDQPIRVSYALPIEFRALR
ncbi:energy transducer TonB [Hymenobacter weizhouensis]|uniref:energy transducer TonB n=1 Tax=Hymenobacter sp. YIM 151500-1 TaxID=2987689 RepID=UPI002227D542|nr:energy transducer TonB [Hymenobacter sp. YIM 151500-1]UYZ64776.1 energy transducer TonB [Hymenobacter sp. YIM 151500-1]